MNTGANAAFWATATGTAPLGFQWTFNGTAIPGATSPMLTVSDAQASDAGSYSVSVTNAAGTVSSDVAALTVDAAGTGAPATLSFQPVSQTVSDGGTVVFNAPAAGGGPAGSLRKGGAISTRAASAITYQWFLNAVAISGATHSTYVIHGATAADNGSYTCVVTDAAGSVVSSPASLDVVASASPGRLVDISCRAQVGTGAGQLIAGYVLGGSGTSGSLPLLVRASGPALLPFGVAGVLQDPQLTLSSQAGLLASNSGWGGSTQIASTASAVGAFAWNAAASHDSALVESLAPGAYTAQVAGASGDTGVALAEVYDAGPAGPRALSAPRLVNISARASVGTGDGMLIAGFVIGGATSETVLIRASGPALAAFGVAGVLPDPALRLLRSNGDGTSTLLGSNTGWGGDAQVAAEAALVGAFPWDSPGTADSAVLITLAPGSYTAEVYGAGGDTGVALVEVYEVP